MKHGRISGQNWVERVVFFLGCEIGKMRLLLGVKKTDMPSVGHGVDRNRPFSIVFALMPKHLFSLPWTDVLAVFCVRCLSEIRNLIVGLYPVDMVNLIIGPNPMNIQPSQPVSKVFDRVNPNNPVAPTDFVARNIPNVNTIRGSSESGKYPSLGVVMKKFTQACCGKIGLNHDVVPYKQLIGERPARVISTGGLRYFNLSALRMQGFSL